MKWLALWLAVAVGAFVLALAAPASASRWTCAHAQQYRTEIQNLTPAQRRAWIKVLKLTKREVRQARTCLHGSKP